MSLADHPFPFYPLSDDRVRLAVEQEVARQLTIHVAGINKRAIDAVTHEIRGIIDAKFSAVDNRIVGRAEQTVNHRMRQLENSIVERCSKIINDRAADPKSVDLEIGRRLVNALEYHRIQFHPGQKERFTGNGPATLVPELRTMSPEQLHALGGHGTVQARITPGSPLDKAYDRAIADGAQGILRIAPKGKDPAKVKAGKAAYLRRKRKLAAAKGARTKAAKARKR